jgi:hypothetical protein
MLELPNFSLHDWVATPDRGRKNRPGQADLAECLIGDPATGRQVGLARERPGAAAWKFWRARVTFDVFEAIPDHPLLCSVQQFRGVRSLVEVHDAEGHLVGRCGEQRIEDAYGWAWACLERMGKTRRFIDAAGHELAIVTPAPSGELLAFQPAVGDNPFARMLLLAAVLAETWRRPRRRATEPDGGKFESAFHGWGESSGYLSPG